MTERPRDEEQSRQPQKSAEKRPWKRPELTSLDLQATQTGFATTNDGGGGGGSLS